MRRGRKPKNNTRKRRDGSRVPLNEREPELPPGVGDPPPHLDAIATKEWERVAPILTDSGVVCQTDVAVLAAYCRAWSLFVKADGQVQKYGEMLISKKTEQPYQSPYLNMMTAAAKQMVSFAAELGMTPAGKARVKASDAGKTDRADDKADLLRFVG